MGPTRVRKSRLVRDVSERLVKQPASDDDQPIIVVEEATSNGGRFSMKHFTIRVFQALRHPMFGEIGYVIRLSESETHLRIRLEQAIVHRRTKYLFIDGAHHLLRTSWSGLAAKVLDSLKCLANATGSILLLAGGGYELFTAGLSPPHLNGRMRVLFERGCWRETDRGQDHCRPFVFMTASVRKRSPKGGCPLFTQAWAIHSMLHSEYSLSWEGCLQRSSEVFHRRSGPHVTPLRSVVQRLRVPQLPGRNGKARTCGTPDCSTIG